MDPATYRARIERLGLTAGACARLFRVADRTHRSWVSEERAIPDTVERVLDQYQALLHAREWLTVYGGAPRLLLRKIEKAINLD